MTVVVPEALLLWALLPVVVWLHALIARKRVLLVGSLGLWKKIKLEARRPRTHGHRIPMTVELGLLLLAMAFLVLALAHPVWLESDRSGRSLILVLDRSASTFALVDGDETALDRIREVGKDVIEILRDEDELVVLTAPDRSVLYSGSAGAPAAVRSIDRLNHLDRPDNWVEVGRQTVGLRRSREERNSQVRVMVVTDSPIAETEEFASGSGEGPTIVDVRAWGPAAGNLGISGFGVRMEASRLDFLVDIDGSGPVEAAELVVRLESGPELTRRRITLSSEGEYRCLDSLTTANDDRPGVVASLEFFEGGSDSLSTDDSVVALPEGARSFAVRIHGGRPRLASALRVAPGVTVREAGGDSVLGDIRLSRVDLVIRKPIAEEPPIERSLPVVLIAPDGDLLFSSEDGLAARLRVGEGFSPESLSVGPDAPPLLFGAEEFTANIESARRWSLEPSAAFSVLAQGEASGVSTPLIVRIGECLVLAFDPEDGGWADVPSFPIFWVQILEGYGAAKGVGGYAVHRTGETVSVPAPSFGELRILGPSGASETVSSDSGWHEIDADRVGTYRLVSTRGSDGGGDGRIRFDLLNRKETRQAGRNTRSSVAPRPRIEAMVSSIFGEDAGRGGGSTGAWIDLTGIAGALAGACMVLLLVRPWLFIRRRRSTTDRLR